jgi:tetratricopeptide (TPR) repeat protein/predicted Ser/Thr protein kinase
MTAAGSFLGRWPIRAPAQGGEVISSPSLDLQPGHVLGGRYEIVGLLGEGGMGAVYKARDREVDREVALKVVRPELTGHPEVVSRFKQELILARQVTHKNVVRIFDLGEAEGAKFISMEYIDGRDLRSFLAERRKFAPQEAVDIVEQVCRALEAAHAEGVIHRDLKPQNIMVDKHGRVAVMDFGIAHSKELPGLTRTGVLLGTPEYMSPEQAKGQETDARSDLFSLGIIFYELLTGESPYAAPTPAASLIMRLQERATPPAKLDPAIPKFVSDVVVRCLEIDPQRRYASAAEILRDLETRHSPHRGLATLHLPRFRQVEHFGTKWIAPGLALLLLLIIGVVFRGKISESGTKPTQPAISLAILPFRNASGDPKLDWLGTSLAEMLSTEVGQSPHLRMVSPDRLHQALHDLQISPDTTLDPNTLHRLAEFSSAETVVWGQYSRFGDEIRIDAKLQDLKHERTAPLKAEAPNEKAVPEAIDRLAEAIRQNLAFSPGIVRELQAQAFKPTSKSLPALHYYNDGVQFLRQGRDLDAQKQFQASIQQDPEFALAYSTLAQADADLGYDNEAEQASRKSVELSEGLPPQERYQVVAAHARIMKDYPKAIESYENLAKASPGDSDVEFTLGSLYQETSDFPKAREHYAAVLKADPQSVETLWKLGGVEIESGNPQGSLDYLNHGLTLSVQTENDEKKALILHAIGVAYKLMNKPQDALRNYQESLAIQHRLGQNRGAATSLNEMAQVYSLLGKPDAALASFNEALKLRQEIGAKKEVGDTLIDLGDFYEDRGQHDQALKMYKESLEIQRDAGDENYQALCLSNIGICHFSKGDYEEALTYYQQALQVREKLKVPGDIAETVHNLAETNVKLGQYGQALGQYRRALDLHRSANDRRWVALDSYGLGTLYGLQGRYAAAVNSEAEAVKTFRELQDRSADMGNILGGYGGALAEAGRWEEAQKTLDEALNLARELKSQPMVAQTHDFQGDSAFYRGDFKSAQVFYRQALQAASRTNDRDKVLASKIGLAEVANQEGRSREAISSLKSLVQEADSLGLKYQSVECSVGLAEALVIAKDYSRARQQLEPALGKAEKLGLRTLLAKGHYLLATALRAAGNGTEATPHYREAVQLLDEIRKEAGAEKAIERADLKAIYAESIRWSQGANGVKE